MYDSLDTYSNDVKYTLQTVSTGKYLLTVAANENWINAEDRAFPVTIDPTITYANVVLDTYTDSAYPNQNYGAQPKMWVSLTQTAYIYIAMPTLPSGSTINSASLIVDHYDTSDVTMTAKVYRVLEDWDELTITYNNAPQLSTTALVTAAFTSNSGSVTLQPPASSFNITQAVIDWIDDYSTNHGIAIQRFKGLTSSVALKTYEHSGNDYSRITINYTHTLADGVYAIKNVSSSTRWITVENDSTEAGSHIQHTYSQTTATAPYVESIFDRSSLFKITRRESTGTYIIRSMLNNNLSFGISGTEVVTKTIPSADDDVPLADTFTIEWNNGGFVISPYGSAYAINLNSTSIANLNTVAKTSVTTKGTWGFVQYTGNHRSGNTFSYTGITQAGNILYATAIVWSTYPEYNIPSVSVATNSTDQATLYWDEYWQEAEIMLHDEGRLWLNVHIDCDADSTSRITFMRYIDISLNIAEGKYFIANKAYELYMQLDATYAPNYSTSAEIIEMLAFNGESWQGWILEHVGDGYYKIISEKSGWVLSIQGESFDTGSLSLVQKAYTGLPQQEWKISLSSSGAYVFRPKSAVNSSFDWCMSGGVIDYTVRQFEYANDSDYIDEWYLFNTFGSDAMLMGITITNHSQYPVYGSIMPRLLDLGYSDFNYILTDSISSQNVLNGMENAHIYVSMSHGYSDETGGHLLLCEDGTSELHAFDIYNFSTNTALIDLSDCELMIFIACYSGAHDTKSLPHAAVQAGAQNAIGFQEEVVCSESFTWLECFFKYYALGYNIEQANEKAIQEQGGNGNIDSFIIIS